MQHYLIVLIKEFTKAHLKYLYKIKLKFDKNSINQTKIKYLPVEMFETNKNCKTKMNKDLLLFIFSLANKLLSY